MVDKIYICHMAGSGSSGHSLWRNFFFSTVAQIMGKGLRYVAATLVIRRLGADAWGDISYALTLIAYILFVLDIGLGPLSVVHKPDSFADDHHFFHWLVPWRLGISVVVGCVLIVFFWGKSPVLQIYLASMPLRALAMEWWFQRRGYHGIYQLLTVLRQVLVVVALSADWIAGPETFAFWDMIGEALTALGAWVCGPRIPGKFWKTPAMRRAWLAGVWRPAGELFIATLFIMIHQNVAIVVLKHKASLAQVGIYDYGYKIALAVLMLGSGFSIPLRRQMGRLPENDRETLRRLILSVQGVLFAISVFFSGMALFVFPQVFSRILPSDSAQGVIAVVQVLSVYIALAFLSVPLSEWLFAHTDKKAYLSVAIQAGLVNALACLWLVPRWGAVGAAWAMVLAEAGIMGRLWWLARRKIAYSAWVLFGIVLFVHSLLWGVKSGALSVAATLVLILGFLIGGWRYSVSRGRELWEVLRRH